MAEKDEAARERRAKAAAILGEARSVDGRTVAEAGAALGWRIGPDAAELLARPLAAGRRGPAYAKLGERGARIEAWVLLGAVRALSESKDEEREETSQGLIDWLWSWWSDPEPPEPVPAPPSGRCRDIQGRLDGLQSAYDNAVRALRMCKGLPTGQIVPAQVAGADAPAPGGGGGSGSGDCAELQGVVDDLHQLILEAANELVAAGCVGG